MSKAGTALTQPEGDRMNYREGYIIKEDFTVRILEYLSTREFTFTADLKGAI